MKKNGLSAKTIVALGAGAVALAASTYYFFGPAGKIHRKKALGWMIKIKGEVVEKLEDAGEVTEQVYHGIVDAVIGTYAGTGKIAKHELQAFATLLKSQWKSIMKAAKGTKKPAKKAVAKKVAKK